MGWGGVAVMKVCKYDTMAYDQLQYMISGLIGSVFLPRLWKVRGRKRVSIRNVFIKSKRRKIITHIHNLHPCHQVGTGLSWVKCAQGLNGRRWVALITSWAVVGS